MTGWTKSSLKPRAGLAGGNAVAWKQCLSGAKHHGSATLPSCVPASGHIHFFLPFWYYSHLKWVSPSAILNHPSGFISNTNYAIKPFLNAFLASWLSSSLNPYHLLFACLTLCCSTPKSPLQLRGCPVHKFLPSDIEGKEPWTQNTGSENIMLRLQTCYIRKPFQKYLIV